MYELELTHAQWHKSSYSSQDGNCVEVAVLPAWRTSTYSGQNGDCVEVAAISAWQTSTYSSGNGACVEVATNLPEKVAVRDSKDRGGAVLAFDAAAWREFTGRR